MLAGDLVELTWISIAARDRCAQLIKVADHRRRGVQVEFPTCRGAYAETVPGACWDEDERTCGTHIREFIDEDVVLALQDVERLYGRRLMRPWPATAGS